MIHGWDAWKVVLADYCAANYQEHGYYADKVCIMKKNKFYTMSRVQEANDRMDPLIICRYISPWSPWSDLLPSLWLTNVKSTQWIGDGPQQRAAAQNQWVHSTLVVIRCFSLQMGAAISGQDRQMVCAEGIDWDLSWDQFSFNSYTAPLVGYPTSYRILI